jgi:hypothetical protein
VPYSCVDDDSADRADAFLKQTGFVSEHLYGLAYDQLKVLAKIDNEAALFACCANDPGTRVVTGDLKSIRALATNAPPLIVAQLQGRILSTEQCVLKIIQHVGFATVSHRWQNTSCEHLFFSRLPGQCEEDVIQLIEGRLDNCTAEMRLLLGWP